MPAAAVPNPPWATGSWSATAWEDGTWGVTASSGTFFSRLIGSVVINSLIQTSPIRGASTE